jgi:hypothetical protein
MSMSLKLRKSQIIHNAQKKKVFTIEEINIDMPLEQIINVVLKKEQERLNVKSIESVEDFYSLVTPEII